MQKKYIKNYEKKFEKEKLIIYILFEQIIKMLFLTDYMNLILNDLLILNLIKKKLDQILL
jgi:hypothetical protein